MKKASSETDIHIKSLKENAEFFPDLSAPSSKSR